MCTATAGNTGSMANLYGQFIYFRNYIFMHRDTTRVPPHPPEITLNTCISMTIHIMLKRKKRMKPKHDSKFVFIKQVFTSMAGPSG